MSVTEIAPRSDDDFERTPPHDVAAEQCVLGGMLLSKDAISDVIEVIRPGDHYRPAHQLIHEAILDLYSRGEPADAITVANELTRRGELARVGGAPYLHTLIASVPTAANAGYYARIVRERAILRRLVEAGTRIVQFGYANDADADDLVDRAQAEVFAVTDRRVSEDYHSLSEIMPGALDEIEAIGSRNGVLTGVPTGFADLDALTNGLHPGQMIVIAARPAVGKALALDTPLPTPAGWTTMSAVRPGDHLVGTDGRPTRVLAATGVLLGRPCYDVEFDDGEVIVADASHQWATWDLARGPGRLVPPRVVTTDLMARTLSCEKALRRSNHAVALTAPLGYRPVRVAAGERSGGLRSPRWRYVVDVRAVASRPVRCVQVDSGDRLYLAGRGMIPTHNSTLALDFARAAAIKNGIATVLFSLEMSRNEITMRLLSAEARVPMQAMRTGQMNDDDWARLARRMSEVADSPLFIDDSPNMSLMEIRAKCRRLKQRHDLRFVIVDYLQLMSSPKRVENRQQEVSEMSRALKLLAKEIDVPVIALSQLNRGPEQRTDKRPMLSDLRESGCMTEDTALLRADTGAPVTFGQLIGDGWDGVLVWSLDQQHRLVAAPVTNVFRSGTREVYRLRLASGRTVKATASHPFLTAHGWTPLGRLGIGDRLAIPGRVPAPIGAGLGWPEHRVGQLARLIAGPGIAGPGIAGPGIAGPGIAGLRGPGPGLPAALFSASDEEVCQFLRHLWAAVGCPWSGPGSSAPAVRYPVASREIACGLAHLLARLGIIAHIRQLPAAGYHIVVAGRPDLRTFCRRVGGHGRRGAAAVGELAALLDGPAASATAETVASVGDIYWDLVAGIDPVGPQPVFDATVKGTHNFIADGLISHNSIEQDSDVVILLHREDMYERESARAGEADLIVAKHRNGPTATVTVAFQGHYSRFVDMAQP